MTIFGSKVFCLNFRLEGLFWKTNFRTENCRNDISTLFLCKTPFFVDFSRLIRFLWQINFSCRNLLLRKFAKKCYTDTCPIFFKYCRLWVFSRSSDYYCRLNLKTSFLLSKGKTDRLLTATILIWSLCSAQIYLILTTKSILVWKSFLAELAQTDSWKGALSSMILWKNWKL